MIDLTKQFDKGAAEADKAMKLVVEISLSILESGNKIASGVYLSRLKDFADKIFDVTYGHMTDSDRKLVMDAARDMNGIKEVKLDANSPETKANQNA